MRLSLSIQTFEKIIENNCVYVDKTMFFYQMINKGQFYFYARPRRFGKSLTVSTLKCIFNAQKELFKNLFIYDKWNWDIKYPIIRIDFSGINERENGLENALTRKLIRIYNEYQLDFKESTPTNLLNDLIYKLIEKYQQKVVILIDEYDKPLLDYIEFHNLERAKANQIILQQFYSVIKSNEDKIQFFFMTGITRFSKMSLFSALNNLQDISYSFPYTQMTGYTEPELLSYFKNDLEIMHKTEFSALSFEAFIEKIRHWYNGYNFGEGEKVYNPWSVMNCLFDKKFNNYWINTGTPKFLIAIMKQNNTYIFDFENDVVSLSDSFSIDKIKLTTLLLQAGYITLNKQISDYAYTFKYPNREVEISMTATIMEEYLGLEETNTIIPMIKIKQLINQDKLDDCFKIFQQIISTIPAILLKKKNEDLYQVLFHSLLIYIGVDIKLAQHFAVGSIDAVIETSSHIYLLEFKINKSTSIALQQIQEKWYFQPYLLKNKSIQIIGVNIVTKTRKLSWEIVQYERNRVVL